MTLRRFQALSLAAFALYSAWFFLPFLGWTSTPESYAASQFLGAGGLEFTQHPFSYVVIFAVRLVATFGLCLFFTWGRSLFAVWLIAGIGYSAFAGVLVSPPIDAALGYASSLVDAALLLLAYNSPVARLFRVDGARAHPTLQADGPASGGPAA